MDKKRSDYIEHGSDKHAEFLGLKKAAKDDPYQCDGWTLVDITQYGPMARPEYLQAILVQKVRELETKPVVSEKAPSIWNPEPVRDAV